MNKAVSTITNIFPTPGSQDALVRGLHSAEGRLAGFITRLSGSMTFVYVHIVWFGMWFLINHGVYEPYIQPFDPFPYGLLTMVVSLEAIFLSTFIMINQNRQAIIETVREIEEDKEELEEEKEVEDIQKDLDDIKNAVAFIQQKVSSLEKTQQTPTPAKPISTA